MTRHRCHGDPQRFAVVASFIAGLHGRNIHYVADVAGGQGILSRMLTKKFRYDCEVIDPRSNVLKGVAHRAEPFVSDMATYYDLLIGLHPDQALRPLAEAALLRPTLIVPCCNFWSPEKLGQKELLQAMETYWSAHGVTSARHELEFAGPHNIGVVTRPPSEGQDQRADVAIPEAFHGPDGLQAGSMRSR